MLSIIIIDYDSIETTVDYIRHFIDMSDKSTQLHFIVVDNYINSNAEKFLKKQFQKYTIEGCELGRVLIIEHMDAKIVYHYTGENLGFAKGNNRGFRIQKILFNDPIVIFSNSDIKLLKPFNTKEFNQLFLHYPDVAVIGPEVIRIDGIKQNPHKKVSAWNRLIRYYWQMLIPFIKVSGDYDYSESNKICYWVSGCFMIVSANKFDDVQGFDEGTFLYGEEMILAERLAKRGYKELFVKDYSIIHETGGTVKRFKSKETSEKICFDSLCYYFSKYRSASKIIIWIARINFIVCKYLLRAKYKIYKK